MKIPLKAFVTPTDEEISQNTDYWSGYLAEAQNPPEYPTFADVADYSDWRKKVDAMLQKPVTGGMVNPVVVGSNCAILDGANWLWLHDPYSPHNKAV